MVDAGRSHAAGVGEGARQRIVKLCDCVKAAVPVPPATRTLASLSSVAVWKMRAAARLPEVDPVS